MMARENRLYLAWVVAIVATLGSLYFSEIKHFIPCVLCWFQRIAMYPLAVMLGVAALTGDFGVRRYALPLAVIGWVFSLMQNLETWGIIKTPPICMAGQQTLAGCDAKWPIWGDNATALNNALTIPVLAMIAFTLIILLLSWRRARV